LVIVILLIIAVSYFYILPIIGENLYEEKRTALKNVTEATAGILAGFDAKVKTGELSLEESQKRSAELINTIRYSGNEYFFTAKLDGFCLYHPSPKISNKMMNNLKGSEREIFCKRINGYSQYKRFGLC
jgi:methyl-accepting chemotaxis protein